ncbi:MAG: aminopeptidase, partial [Elusimicrobiaceae bacterium]|nr:aminopeptidase [Elusimicrobiaceae bacterium]
MFDEKKLHKYADVIIWALKLARKNKFKKHDTVLVNFEKDALLLAEIVHEKLAKEKIHTIISMLPTAKISKDFFANADDIMLKNIPAGRPQFIKSLNGYIVLRATEDLLSLKNIKPKKLTTATIAKKKIRDIMNKREQTGDFGWTLANFPTNNMAKTAKLSLKEYSNQIEKACFLNEKDPVKKWKSVVAKIHNIEKWLNGLKIDTLYMKSKNTDLEIKLGKDRKFIGGRGANIPSFEIFISPDHRYTKGIYFADLPSYINGNYVKNLKLEFHQGKVVNLKADEGEEFARKMIFMDEGSCQLGE